MNEPVLSDNGRERERVHIFGERSKKPRKPFLMFFLNTHVHANRLVILVI